jgi:hypothetical protein
MLRLPPGLRVTPSMSLPVLAEVNEPRAIIAAVWAARLMDTVRDPLAAPDVVLKDTI